MDFRRDRSGTNRLEKVIKELSNKTLKVGWFESAKYDDGTPVAYVATIQEYGFAAKNIPPRPFMRPTKDHKMSSWKEYMRSGAKAVLRGGVTIDQVFDQVGGKMVGDLKQAIVDVTSPALKQSTVDARSRRYATKGTVASNKPLVDSKLMLNTVTYIVGRL